MKTDGESKHGGARVGAGRKPKLQYEARELFQSAVDERWGLIMGKLDKLITDGDFNTIRWILEQRIGKAPQSLEVTTQGDKITPPDEPQSLTGYLIESVSEVLRIVQTEGVDPEEAMKRFREWHRTTPRQPVSTPQN